MDMRTYNAEVASDMWAAGNSFTTKPVIEGDHIIPPHVLPLSAFISYYLGEDARTIHRWRILTTTEGIAAAYTKGKLAAMNTYELSSDQILHFAIDRENGLPLGTGLGTKACRRGIGYKTDRNESRRAASPAEQWDMLSDMAGRLLYQGQQRHIASIKGGPNTSIGKRVVDDMRRWLSHRPLSHYVVSNADADVKTIGLGPKQDYDSLIEHLNHEANATLNDVEDVIMNNAGLFSHASSSTVIEMIMPAVKSYQEAHAHFIKQNIYRPIIEYYIGPEAWDIINLEIIWGGEKTPSVEQTLEYLKLAVQHTEMSEQINWRAALEQVGVLPLLSEKEVEQIRQEREQNRMLMQQQMMQNKKDPDEEEEWDDEEDEDEEIDNDEDEDEETVQKTRYFQAMADRLEQQKRSQ